MKRLLLILSLFILTACGQVPSVDVSKATCDTINEFRQMVGVEYGTKIEVISDAFWQARRAFQNELNECMYQAWTGNVCDKEWEERSQAYETAMGDISNEEAYQNYKAKKSAWEACRENFDDALEKWSEENRQKEQLCQQHFQAKVDAAIEARQAEEATANAKKESDLAALDALEEKCKKEKEAALISLANDAKEAVAIQNAAVHGGTTYEPNSAQCTGQTTRERPKAQPKPDEIPGENATPRTGKPADLGAKDVIINLATAVAEDITGTPIPTSAISDQVFAGIVCVKIYSRILEMQQEESDAIWSGNRRAEIALRQKIARYRRAQQVWCAIAAGNTSVAQVKQDVATINAMPDGSVTACTSDSNCGPAICCSAKEIGKWVCNEDGQCGTHKEMCPDDQICSGKPASCIAKPVTIKALFYGGKLIPLTEVRSTTGEECGKQEHWHANRGSVRALDGTTLPDPAPTDCGFGKVGDVPVVDVDVPADQYRVEVRMGF